VSRYDRQAYLTGVVAASLSFAAAGSAFAQTTAPLEYAARHVKGCSLYGPAWLQIPDTDTCIRLMRLDMKTDYRQRSTRKELFVEPDRDESGPLVNISRGELPRDRPIGRALSEMKAFVDTRTETDFGPLIATLGWKIQIEGPARRPNDPNNEFNRTGVRGLPERASIQLGGFTAGYRPSFFDFSTASLSYTTAYASETSTNVLAYTKTLPAGWSATVALEDPQARRVFDAAWGQYSSRTPSVVTALDGSFSWGAVHLAAATHPVRGVSPTGEVGSRMGYAATAAIEHWFDLSFGMSGDVLVSATTTRGGLSYLNASNYPADFAISPDGVVDLTAGSSFVVSYLHAWTKQLRSIFTVSKFWTSLETRAFNLKTDGLLLQANLDYRLASGLSIGLEVNSYHDTARTSGGGRQADQVANSYLTGLLYLRRKL
jgi:hypothetical protein